MKTKNSVLKSTSVVSIIISLLTTFPSEAQQIVPDTSLPNNTRIKLEGNTSNIEGGTQAGTNLFHSFQDFSVSAGSTAYFNNTLNIQNIISRVTGKSISNIDGLIRANGTANLLLINPNGIVFGQNALLNIGGSFLASTASSLKFADGSEFSTTKPQAIPLLTVSVPLGLQFRGNPGRISAQGLGHIIQGSDFNFPFDANKLSNGLQINGKTLALIGGDISVEGAIFSSKNGSIEIGSVDKGDVNIKQENSKWVFSYENNPIFRDINLSQNALVYVGSNQGTGKGINFQGREIKVLGGSLVASQSYGYKDNGGMTINASHLLEVKGESQFSVSTIFTSNFGKTPGENIEINAGKIDIQGAQIATTAFSDAPGGNLTINADNLKSAGSTPSTVNPLGSGGIQSFSYNSGFGGDLTGRIKNLILENRGTFTTISANSSAGQSGNLDLIAENIVIKSGSSLGSLTFSKGNGGNVLIRASDSIEVTGRSPFLEPSLIQATTFNSGNAGKLEIFTPKLFVRDGGTVNTSTLSFGNAGDLTINASELIEVSGTSLQPVNSSSIASSASVAQESLRVRLRLPEIPTGNAGNLTLNTRRLNITKSAQVNVQNSGLGNAGELEINADNISITDKGIVTATTAVGQGGDIRIRAKDILRLSNGIISATAGEQGSNGDGGNITIDTKNLLSLGDSSITANAFTGKGGNILINTDWFFSSLNSRFEASSQFGINGQVEINGFYLYPSGIKAAPEAIRATPEIASVCQSRSGGGISKFVVTGIDNLLPSPNDLPSNSPIWQDNSLSGLAANNSSEELKSIAQEATPIIEMQSLINKADGTVILTAKSDQVTVDAALSASLCSAEMKSSKN
ncbi:filamentous hemagglutinin N-terminal domain-containing protein [Nostoc sp. B(2019)]|nr:filamentous hemagglutinin N-terminal domain-containing protein [Nostoc sp. B(2019)]